MALTDYKPYTEYFAENFSHLINKGLVYTFIWCLFLAEIWFQKKICLENLGESISSLCFQEIFMWHRTFLWQLETILFSKTSWPEAICGKYFFFFYVVFNFYMLLLSERKWKWKLLSPVWLFAIPWTIQSMEFSRPEYWSG